ncbi:MAG: HNH endonuclease domain-containing protein [Bacteroidales bacterium]
MNLPSSNGLPVNLLAACFNNTSATYKYYWFLSILHSIEGGNTSIQKRDLFARMISNAWYTVNYFHISFGKQDRLQRAIEVVKSCEPLTIDDKRDKILNQLINTNNKNSLNQLKYFNNQVPHWFLSPWFPQMNRNDIYLDSQGFKNQCLYSLNDELIEINEEWLKYLSQNVKVLKDFCYWNLAIFLQSKNPNVPDIPNKLIKPALRNSLNNQRKNFWDIVVEELGSVDCIYTGKKLTIGKYAVEHFIPYAFVSHDLIWNLIPADKSFNSSKSDKLPPLDKYFNPFFLLQESAIKIVKEKNPKNKLLEDYLTIFSDLEETNGLSEYFTKEKFRDRLQPLITIASNNGFEFMH